MLVIWVNTQVADFYPDCTLADARGLPITFRYYARNLPQLPRQWSMFLDVSHDVREQTTMYGIIAFNYHGSQIRYVFWTKSA